MCDTAVISFKGVAISGWTDAELWGLACHEAGHSFGLRHPPTNNTSIYRCMVSGAPFRTHWDLTTWHTSSPGTRPDGEVLPAKTRQSEGSPPRGAKFGRDVYLFGGPCVYGVWE